MRVIKTALSQSGHLPKKQFDDAESFNAYFKDKGSILIDATEQRTQRPEDDAYQKQLYSGKKAHAVKTLVLATTDRYIHFVSKGWVGQSHDYKQLKYEFPPDQLWFKDLPVMLDLGYQGFRKDYDCQSVSQTTKKPGKAELSVEQQAENQQISSGRIYVEPHRRTDAIGGLKRYRYLSDRLRTHKVGLYESASIVCAGIWNFYLTN